MTSKALKAGHGVLFFNSNIVVLAAAFKNNTLNIKYHSIDSLRINNGGSGSGGGMIKIKSLPNG